MQRKSVEHLEHWNKTHAYTFGMRIILTMFNFNENKSSSSQQFGLGASGTATAADRGVIGRRPCTSVDVASGCDEIVYHVDVSGLDRQMERRQSANAIGDRHRGINGGTCRQEAAQYPHVTVPCRQVKRRYVPEADADVVTPWAGAGLGLARFSGHSKLGPSVDVTSGVDESTNDDRVTSLAGKGQRRYLTGTDDIQIAARSDEQLNEVDPTVP